MRMLLRAGGRLTALACVVLVVACDDLTSKTPTSPGATFVSGVEISAPATFAPGESVQLTALVRMANGTLKALTSADNPRWRSLNELSVQVTPAGLLTARQVGEAIVILELTQSGVSRQSSKEVVVAPEGLLFAAGPYTITVDVVGGCLNPFNPLPADLQHRSYDALLTQIGLVMDVALTEPRFRVQAGRGNRFSGRITPAGTRFTLEDIGYDEFGPGLYRYPNVAEVLPNGFLVVSGTVLVTASAAGVSGVMEASIGHYGAGFPEPSEGLGGCFTRSLRFGLTPR